MPAYVASRQALACKLVSFYPNNAAINMNTHNATILLFDESTGTLKSVSRKCSMKAVLSDVKNRRSRCLLFD